MILDALKRLFGGGMEPPGGISCEEAMARIQEFIDGELDPAEAGNVEEHFDVCTRCYPHLKLEEGFRKRVREALRQPTVPEDLREGVLEILEREEKGEPG
ncbi:MAG: zf-HC2 domain-containing protein [Gemmatimonadales bacterium]|jgi:anti-sigma factor (TIGR02949 family)|nr:MAG: zf-HC2 domain-containing protein [Gemmatimonadales bacterium]